MPDNFCNPWPARAIDPNEPGLLAGYTFADGELATFSRYLNRAALGGAAYDLTTRVGTPLVGQGGGILAVPGSLWRHPGTIPVGDTNFSYCTELEYAVAATAWASQVQNCGHYITRVAGGGDRPCCGLDNGATLTTPAFPIMGRGPARWDVLYDGTNQIAVMNGLQVGLNAVVPNIGGGAANLDIGAAGCTRLAKVYNVRRTVAQARASYVREFAKQVVYHWQPSAVGEGPAGGIPTGAVGEGDWYCPSGGATLQRVWRNDLSAPGGGRLVLTDTGVTQRRLAYMHPKAACFGSWVLRYEVRDPATDSLQFALSPLRDNDYTAAASNAYWVHLRQVAGPWWRASLYLANGAQLDAVDTPSLPIVGDRGVLLLTHHVDGTWQIYNYLRSLRSWYWSVASPLEVTSLSTNYVHIAPRGAYIEGFTRFQGEADPQELELAVP